MNTAPTILLVEDNEDDVFLMRRALQSAKILNPVQVAEDGRLAVEYLSGVGKFSDRNAHPLPSLVFLDLKLPYKNGFEVLTWIRAEARFKNLPVVVLTSSCEPADVLRAEALGIECYMVKPPKAAEILEFAKAMNIDWLQYGS